MSKSWQLQCDFYFYHFIIIVLENKMDSPVYKIWKFAAMMDGPLEVEYKPSQVGKEQLVIEKITFLFTF